LDKIFIGNFRLARLAMSSLEKQLLDRIELRKHYDRETIKKLEKEINELEGLVGEMYDDLALAMEFIYTKKLRDEFILYRADKKTKMRGKV